MTTGLYLFQVFHQRLQLHTNTCVSVYVCNYKRMQNEGVHTGIYYIYTYMLFIVYRQVIYRMLSLSIYICMHICIIVHVVSLTHACHTCYSGRCVGLAGIAISAARSEALAPALTTTVRRCGRGDVVWKLELAAETWRRAVRAKKGRTPLHFYSSKLPLPPC